MRPWSKPAGARHSAALSHPERIFLGLALLHRYKNSREDSPMTPLFALLNERETKDAEILGKIAIDIESGGNDGGLDLK